MESLIRDVRFAVRTMMKKPGFTAVAVIIMALGIGANTAIFSLVRAVLLRPLPFADPDRLVMVWEDASYVGFPKNTPAPGNFADWRARNDVFEAMAAFRFFDFNLTGDGPPDKIYAYGVTSEFFPVLGVQPALGRVFTAEEDRPEAGNVAIISYPLWQSRYGGDAGIVGRDILLNDTKYTVVGVMPRGFQLLDFMGTEIRLWTPAKFSQRELRSHGNHYLQVVARLKPGVTIEQANNNIKTVTAQIARDNPDQASRLDAFVVSLRDELTGESRRPLIVLLIAVAFVLLIAAANLANLLLSRALGRSKEVAVRTALGASRGRLVRQLLTESVLLSFFGGLAGVAVAYWSFVFLRHLVPPGLALFVDLRIDMLVLVFTLALSVITGMIFGLAPAMQSLKVDLNETLKQGGGRTNLSVGHRRLQNAMIVGEVALAMVLLVGAGLLIKTFAHLSDQYASLHAESVLAVRTQLPDNRYSEPARRIAFYRQVLDQVKALPGVVSAAYTTSVPLDWKGGTNGILIEGRPVERGVDYDANHRQISPDYFSTIGIALRQGRQFNDGDNERTMPVAIVNEAMAREFWPGEEVIGKRFKTGGEASDPWITIVGVVSDLKQMAAEAPPKPEMYFPYQQQVGEQPWYAPRDLVLRTSVAPTSLVPALTAAIHQVDRDQPVSDVRTMKDVLGQELGQRETGTTLLGVFAALALLLAAIGLYGVLSYFVSQRIPEFGVRMALGAKSRDILWLVLKRGMGLALLGLAIGLAASFALTRLMQSLLFEVSASDPLVFALIALLLAGVALAACIIPARRAMKIDPMVALRYE
ncbi:MAG TPA: ABC transporter permease [Blastocatellia bacterium]|nr:ABC transporter permease [Blastocatellia bacterium]